MCRVCSTECDDARHDPLPLSTGCVNRGGDVRGSLLRANTRRKTAAARHHPPPQGVARAGLHPTVGLCLGPYGGPRGGGCFLSARFPCTTLPRRASLVQVRTRHIYDSPESSPDFQVKARKCFKIFPLRGKPRRRIPREEGQILALDFMCMSFTLFEPSPLRSEAACFVPCAAPESPSPSYVNFRVPIWQFGEPGLFPAPRSTMVFSTRCILGDIRLWVGETSISFCLVCIISMAS